MPNLMISYRTESNDCNECNDFYVTLPTIFKNIV